MMIKEKIKKLMEIGVGYNLSSDKLMLRSLDDGCFAVSYDLENPDASWEEEFSSDDLDSAIDLFLKSI